MDKLDIRRFQRKGNNDYSYYHYNRKITDPKILDRIKKLSIPPQWKDVKISSCELEYIQVTGVDSKNRIQYIYHPMWVQMTQDEKYQRMGRFASEIDRFEKKINIDLNSTNPEIQLIAGMFRIVQKTHMRIGNDTYARENNTYGLCTLEKKHVYLSRNGSIRFVFVGKKGISQNIKFRDNYTYLLLQKLIGLPGSRLFKYNIRPSVTRYIDAQDMNSYLQKTMGEEFSCKDFRTYASNILFLGKLVKIPPPETLTKRKKIICEIFDMVAIKLGHTRSISRRSYVMKVIPETYLTNPEKIYGKNPKKLLLELVSA